MCRAKKPRANFFNYVGPSFSHFGCGEDERLLCRLDMEKSETGTFCVFAVLVVTEWKLLGHLQNEIHLTLKAKLNLDMQNRWWFVNQNKLWQYKVHLMCSGFYRFVVVPVSNGECKEALKYKYWTSPIDVHLEKHCWKLGSRNFISQ